ncbi:NEL-type E3 ubiquitin ligase domain-containing protein [Pseudomonas sp. Z18(2022)]|uniref:NEL-type E3 ubiquitin ligase domain-containing protein n=1 Tax=Pseudomonas sp. Z18(2022) TaxID=2983410 RepID=UPI002E81909B|nr:NEL-type E3 ubiquitin ligase domain-containing protein [Pseudomonas sp. Z18(2022)]
MADPITPAALPDTLYEFMMQQRAPLMAEPEWQVLQALDAMRASFDDFFGALNHEERLEYVRLQGAWVEAQKALEQAVLELTDAFRQQALASLRSELKILTGQDIDPSVARIHTRYLQPASRVRRASSGAGGTVEVASITFWDAACMSYDGLTGWSYPGRTGLADASYLDAGINATAGQFIALVRRLDIGGQLKTRLDQALMANAALGSCLMGLATTEFEFALIEALKNTTASRIDRDKYQYVKRALTGEVRWGSMEEMLLFVPHGVDNVSWVPQSLGLTGQYVGPPPGDRLTIPHLVFSVSGCNGAFSFFPNRPGGSLRHHGSHREACQEFHVAFQAFYRSGHVDWLYQMMLLRDCARLKQIVKVTPPPDAGLLAKLLYSLAQAIPRVDGVKQIGYVRTPVEKVPIVSLYDFYVRRSRANLQELANETSGFMTTLIELFQALITEILDVLLIPAPGALKGLGRVRALAMFVAMEQALVEGGALALQGEPGEFLQGLVDVADLLIGSRLHTRLDRSVQRRHQRLFQRLSVPRAGASNHQALTNPQVLERMLGTPNIPARDLDILLDSSATSRQTLNQVWQGVRPSASLTEAVNRFRADRLIEWVAQGADPGVPSLVGAVEVMAPLLTQLDNWPAETALSIENQQGLEVRRYSKMASSPATDVIRVTRLENHQFAYATARRISIDFPQAIVELLPAVFAGGTQPLRQQLAALAKALKIDLFEALTQFADASRSVPGGAGASVRRLLPDSIGHEYPVPAVITQLRALYPELSQARLLEVLREHPLSEHQQTQLLHSQLQPEALYDALRAALQAARRSAIVDGVFHPRRFNRQTQAWAAAFADGVLRDVTGLALVVSPAKQAVPYVSRRAGDQTVVVIDQNRGRFSPFFQGEGLVGAMFTGADSFYQAVLIQLSENDQRRFGVSTQQAITGFRYRVAQALLSNRVSDGSFYPCQRAIEHYASAVDAARLEPQPDALGLYRLGADRYLFLDSAFLKVVQGEPPQPWRVQHPVLKDAYAPVLSHNSAGSWHHEWENPLTWDGHKPFHRLGPLVSTLSPDDIMRIQQISGVSPDILRRMHVRNERPPAVLVETIERFKVHQRVKAGMELGADFFDEVLAEVGAARADALVGRAGLGRAEQIALLEEKVLFSPPTMERYFFKALLHKSELSSDPLAQVVQRHFPGLTAAVAEELVRQTNADEARLLESGRVPWTLTPYVRWWIDYLRKARAFEGVHLPAAASGDSSKLILHTLPYIDGWPNHLRVEVWERGRLIDSIGPVDGSLKRELESVAGQYQAYIPQLNGGRQPIGNLGAFLPALLAALPEFERRVLGYTHASGVEELTLIIGDHLERNRESSQALLKIGRNSWRILPRRIADGRIGYPLSGGDELRPMDRAQVLRMRELFPSLTDTEVLDLLLDAGDSFGERKLIIDHLFSERNALNTTLQRWNDEALVSDPDSISAGLRALAVTRIQRCWAREGLTLGVAQELNLDSLDLASLPTLSAHFGHVTVLSLKNNRLTELPSHFLRSFPGLRVLYFNGNRLTRLPSLEGAPYLAVLNLAHNRLKFDLQSELELEALTGLRSLDLSFNPLGQGRQLSFYRLTNLQELSLRAAGLNRLPRGAVALRSLRSFDLRDNQISELAETDLFIYPHVHRGINLRGNPLSPQARQMLRRLGERQGQPDIDFGLWEPAASLDQRANRWLALLPPAEVQGRERDWAALQEQPMADYFFELLGSIAKFPGFVDPEYRAQRENVTRRIWALIDEALFHDGVNMIAYLPAYRFMSGGIDGWLLCLHELELHRLPQQMLAANVQSAGPAFVHYYRALRRIDALNQLIAERFAPQSTGHACTRILSYRIALATSLDLPQVLPERFSASTAIPDAQSVDTLRRAILRQESGINWPARLQRAHHWVTFLERKYTTRFESVLKRFDRALEIATDKVANGLMTEGEYLNYITVLQGARQMAKNTLIEGLTQQEWENFVVG